MSGSLMIKIEFLQYGENKFISCPKKAKPTSVNKDDIPPLTFFTLRYFKVNVGVLQILL